MLRLRYGRKVFRDGAEWYHVDYMCRREIVELGSYRKMLRFMGYYPDLNGTPILATR